MPIRWRKPQAGPIPLGGPVDLKTLRIELNRATDTTAERLAAVVDSRFDAYHDDLLQQIHRLQDMVASLSGYVEELNIQVEAMKLQPPSAPPVQRVHPVPGAIPPPGRHARRDLDRLLGQIFPSQT